MALSTGTEVAVPSTLIFGFKQVFVFLKLCWGCLNKPYETYRKLSLYSFSHQLIFILFIMVLYFLAASTIKEGLADGKLNIVVASFKATLVTLFTFLVTATTLYLLGKLFTGKGSFFTFLTLWSFTLLPTLAWFLVTAAFYVLLPPPRTTSISGQVFSAFFIAFSIGCLIWKLILYYLTLRFSLRLGTIKITAVSLIVGPLLVIYALLFYKVPFI